ncbi:PfkB family carbohydrate kinase [Pararhizobium sp. PWRC1-1]|uniref:PfkB family carbohydrate kinase n=1 Tax=Pararhizobium sp. PWRC1-1 TaxID=2804566 RepID=UPI003CF83304
MGDTQAAGDIFHSALRWQFFENKSVNEAARFACASASLKRTKFGGRLGCPTRQEVDFFSRIRDTRQPHATQRALTALQKPQRKMRRGAISPLSLNHHTAR